MPQVGPHRKTIRHFHEPGDVHELTFSCYRRLPILTNNAWRAKLSSAIDEACQSVGCYLAAFVYMPEHVHLLVWGIRAKEDVSRLLGGIKRPTSAHVRDDLERTQGRLLKRLTVCDRGRLVFRYWQEGPGFDRNLFTVSVVQASIDYIHNNPVKRGPVPAGPRLALVERPLLPGRRGNCRSTAPQDHSIACGVLGWSMNGQVLTGATSCQNTSWLDTLDDCRVTRGSARARCTCHTFQGVPPAATSGASLRDKTLVTGGTSMPPIGA